MLVWFTWSCDGVHSEKATSDRELVLFYKYLLEHTFERLKDAVAFSLHPTEISSALLRNNNFPRILMSLMAVESNPLKGDVLAPSNKKM